MSDELTRQSIEQKIRVKFLEDDRFRQQLLASPKDAIEGVMGLNIPKNLEIGVLEKSTNHLILSIPPLLPESANEFSKEELEVVAGGINLFPGQYNTIMSATC